MTKPEGIGHPFNIDFIEDFGRVVMRASRFRIRFTFPFVDGFLPVVSQYGLLVALHLQPDSEPDVPKRIKHGTST